MANVFNGKDFLATKAAEIEFSNGLKVTVCEVNDEQMEMLSALGSEEAPTSDSVRKAVAALVGTEAEALKNVGLIELRGAMDFLTERLFG